MRPRSETDLLSDLPLDLPSDLPFRFHLPPIYLSTSQGALSRANTGISPIRVTPGADTAWITNGGPNVRFRRRRPAEATAREAIEYLASACDGAIRRDGHGFNREHVVTGHALAQKRRWSRRDRTTAERLTVHYQSQLRCAGLVASGALRARHRPAPQWAPDPTGVHRLRFWDGSRWTAAVSA